MEFLFNALSRADIFGHPITLNLELRSKYQSTVGGFISLAIIILLGAYTINEIIGYVNARTIAITTETLFSYDPGQLILQSKQFMFAIYMRDLWEAPAYDIRVQILGITNSTQQLKKCSQEQFEQVVNTNLSDLFIFDEWLCPNENFTLNLIGSKLALGSNKFQYLQISITECIEQTQWGVECGKDLSLPTDVHFLTTNNVFKKLFFLQIKYLNPTQNGIVADSYVDSSLIFNFQPQVFHQRIDYTFQNHFIQDYNGQIKIQGLVNPEEIQNVPTNSYQYIPVGLVQQEYTIINFFLGNFKTQYSRDYQTITDLLSKIGGLFQSIIGIAGFLISYYNRQKFYAELSNKLYDFNFDHSYQSTRSSKSLEQHIKESSIKKKRKKRGRKDGAKDEAKDEVKDEVKDDFDEQGKEDSQDETPGMREKIQNVLSQHHENAREFKNQKHFLLTMFQNIIMTKEQLNLSFRYFLHKITCRQTKKDDTKLFILQRAIGRVQKELDVFSILERLHQVEKLKRILFDKDQLILFNYSPKPVISIHDEKDTMDFVKYQKTFTLKRSLKDIAHEVKLKLKNKFLNKEDVNIEEIYNSYRSIAEQNRSSTRFYYKINNKLKDYLGSQLKAIFKASKLINFDDYNKEELAIQSDIAIENLAKTPRNLIITRPTSNNKTKIEFFRDI